MSFMSDNYLTIHDRLEDILDSINLIQDHLLALIPFCWRLEYGLRCQGPDVLHVGKESTHQRWYNGTLVHFE